MVFQLLDVVEDGARLQPDRQVLVTDTGDASRTWGELNERSSRVAAALAAEGVGSGSRVAYLDVNSLEFFELLFGARRLGAVLAPLNWRLTALEIGQIVQDAQASVLVLGIRFAAWPRTSGPRLMACSRTSSGWEAKGLMATNSG
ncbi:MAG TPA: AMP-binding protein [Frankiaceae bacterium]|nr:AMP-binding protein [Frankiaceae bacterium]